MIPSLIGLDFKDLKQLLSDHIPEKQLSMRARQIFSGLYISGVDNIHDITPLGKELRHDLDQKFSLKRLSIAQCQTSDDGTIKWLLKTDDQQLIETVFIPEEDRGTLCISSQVGCTLNCTFCHTGTQRLVKNLSPEEILGQILVAKDHLQEWKKPSDQRRLTNIVLMGMGEPLYNYEHVKKAMHIAMDENGLAFGKRRITLSTSGVVPFIQKTGEELGVNLAISLHAVTDELRDKIVPINKKYPIKDLLDACRHYPTLSNARRITFEYVMLKDVNDSLDDARGLVKLLKGIPSKINLIPFNSWPGAPYECSSWEQIKAFAQLINDCGYASPIRMPRGRDILAACGQLKSASEKKAAHLIKKEKLAAL